MRRKFSRPGGLMLMVALVLCLDGFARFQKVLMSGRWLSSLHFMLPPNGEKPWRQTGIYDSAPPINTVFVSSVFLRVKKARLPQSSHLAVSLVTVSANGITSRTDPKLLLHHTVIL